MRSSAVGFRLQPDWDKAFSERDKAIWFHEYSSTSTQYHKLSLKGEEYVADERTCNFSFVSPRVLKLYSAPHAVTRIFQAADVEFSLCHPVHRAHLSCMDIGPGGDLGLSSSSEKSVYLWETGTGEIRRKLEGHVGEVYSCRFFPSGLTALTAGADMQLKIWCLLTGTCAATLAPGIAGAVTGTSSLGKSEPGGHRSGILDTGIIYRGRNVISIDRLGWMRLWDVTTQVCISGIPLVPRATSPAKYVCPVLEEACCLCVKKQHTLPLHIQDVAEDNSSWFHALETSSRTATEVATSDAVVAVGMGCRATVQLYELAARSKGCVARFTLPHATGSIEACAFPQSITQPPPNSPEAMDVDAEHQTCAFLEYGLYAGGQNGELASWDLRYPLRPLMQISDEKGAVHQIKAFASPNGSQVLLLVGRSDGRVVVYSYNPSVGNSDKLTTLEDPSAFSQSTLELTGINCEPVRGLVGLPHFRGTNLSIWTASLGGVFRYYQKLATDLAFG